MGAVSHKLTSGGSGNDTPKILYGRYVLLRPLTRDDLEQRLQWVNDPEVQRAWVGVTTAPNAPEDMRAWFHLVSEDPLSEQWAIELQSGGGYAGDIDLHSIDPVRKEAWINPLLGAPEVRQRPVRRDVFATIARYAFDDKQLESLWAQIPSTDPETIAVLQELGFEQVEETLFDFIEGVHELTLVLRRNAFRVT